MKNNFEEEKEYLEYVKESLQKEKEYCVKEMQEIPKRYTNVLQGDSFLVEELMSLQATKHRKLKLAESKPYFGRIDFLSDGSNNVAKIYIGKTTIHGKNNENVTTDWRTPICSLYYDSDLGRVSYEAPSGLVHGNLKLKRQIIIEDGRLVDVLDTSLVSNDELLQPYLNDIHFTTVLLINVNNPKILTRQQNQQLLNTLDNLSERNWFQYTINGFYKASLGCNIYTTDIQDYQYIWELVRNYKIPTLRVSIVCPKFLPSLNKNEYYIQMKPIFLWFVQQAQLHKITLTLDCSQIPICYFSADEILFIQQQVQNFNSFFHCDATVAFSPTGQILPCFGMPNFNKWLQQKDNNFNQYQSLFEIKQLIEQNHIQYQEESLNKCVNNCLLKNISQCQNGCLASKI